ncbi:hypothetical protein HY385_00400, partial [Candidatus Daviesbacteria bacterium]|nr:hypothetical protein [Candidatus Daviesbacteria bacterium]
MEFYFFALAAQGSGISGGDKIFIEFARRWSKKFPVTVFLSKEGYKMCVRQGLNSKLKTKNSKLSFKIYNIEKWQKLGFLTEYIARIIQGIT